MGLLDFLFSDDENVSEDNRHQTVTIDDKWGIPRIGERLLVVHEDCQILKWGNIIGLQTASFQYLTCCVTDKRVILLPQDVLPNQSFVSLIGSLLGINPIGKYILMREMYDKRIDNPYEILRENINKIDVGMDERPEMQGVSIYVNGERLLLGCKDLGYALDIQAAFNYPEWDWND